MSSNFFTNQADNTVFNKFVGIFTNTQVHAFDVLVGYFRSSGYFKIRKYLESVEQIRIIVGINADKIIAESAQKGLIALPEPKKVVNEFQKNINEDIQNAPYNKTVEDGIKEFIQDVQSKKVQLRVHPSKKLHAKVYIFRPVNFNVHNSGEVITGSSNLTDAGLGTNDTTTNYEFNVLLKNYDDVKFATDEFEKLWEESQPITKQDIEPITKGGNYVYENPTPFELYIKLLIEYFGDAVEYDSSSLGDLPTNFKKLSYQMDAVHHGFNKLLTHDGFFLADVVGLGKTVVAALITKEFINRNGRDKTKVLVVYPPALEKNWKETFKQFAIDTHTKFITNGSLYKILDNNVDYWSKEEYDLILVDESHKYRNHKTVAFENLQLICKSPRKNKGLIEGTRKKVILISATPLNNKPDDIYYQVQLFLDSRNAKLDKSNLQSFFSPLNEEYKRLKSDSVPNLERIREIYAEIRKHVVEPLTIRRTRADLEKIKRYKDDITKQGIKFPKVQAPIKVEYNLDAELNELFHKTVLYLTDKDENDKPKYLFFSRYQAIGNLIEEIRIQHYPNALRTSMALSEIMKNQLVKRLESSFNSFKLSLKRLLTATEQLITMFENRRIFIAPDLRIGKLLDEGKEFEEIEAEIYKLAETKPDNKVFTPEDFVADFLPKLRRDVELLSELVHSWNQIERDPKMDMFLEKMKTTFFDIENNKEQKIVIFSESKDTVQHIKTKLDRKDILDISSENREQLFSVIQENFDANIPKEQQKNDFNIIITTEVLSEGVNLHRSNVILHYDTPWNSTKLMQRIGRVNRIGSTADFIFNYVFYPSAQGDKEIRLNKSSIEKIQGFHSAYGEDNQVYSEDEILDEVKLFSEESIEEKPDEKTVRLDELRTFKKQYPEWYKRISKLSKKSRVGRSLEQSGKTDVEEFATISYIKAGMRSEFYLVSSSNSIQKISAIEAMNIFEASKEESPVSLPEIHYEHIHQCEEDFKNEEVEQQKQVIIFDQLGGVGNAARKFLQDIKYNSTVDSDKIAADKLLVLLEDGTYANLPSALEKLSKDKKKNFDQILEEFRTIALKYITSIDSSTKKEKTRKPHSLIISESFIK